MAAFQSGLCPSAPIRTTTAWVGSQGGNLRSQGPREVVFGLGKQRKIDSLEVVWPSGLRIVKRNVRADQLLVLLEPLRAGRKDN